ncbi:hypothetical protein [Lacrimispora sp.]|uniref:hypothetical protein n=1 Tax=Lacrimispora sp. TaxID=2719234 RepID=UPI0028B1ED33|nr:hypothetical protein [Lacrimispora sp.]
MGDIREDGELLKLVHNEKVKKTPDRIEYAIKQFEENGIEYRLLNESTGHFHCWGKRDRSLYQFWAGTGKIMGHDNIRGISSIIEELLK